MGYNPMFEERRVRLHRTQEILNSLEDGIEIRKAIAILNYNLGTSRKTALQYITELADMGIFITKDGKIYKKAQKEKAEERKK